MKFSWGGEICVKLKGWRVAVEQGVCGRWERCKGGGAEAGSGIDCRVVRGRESEPVTEVNESRGLPVILMRNRVEAVWARNKLRT